jgi:hypothetical protein
LTFRATAVIDELRQAANHHKKAAVPVWPRIVVSTLCLNQAEAIQSVDFIAAAWLLITVSRPYLIPSFVVLIAFS